MPNPDHLEDLAAKQQGVVTRAQLQDAGVGRGAIARWLGNGRLQPCHPGVYGLGHLPSSPLTAASAAVHACGLHTALSHRSAAALWGILPAWPEVVEVTGRGYRVVAGVRFHRTRSLLRREVTRREGINVTTPARTLLDLAVVLDDRELTRAVNEARVLRLVSPTELAEAIKRARGKRGAGRLRAILEPPGAPTESILEDEFGKFLDDYGIPRGLTNQRIGRWKVDMVWPEQRLIVELDGRAFHDHPEAFERDREKDAELQALGFRVVRITWRRLKRQPAVEAARLTRLLSAP
jgi:hypothetical protein